MMIRARLTAGLLLVLVIATPPAAAYDPALHWRTIETEHFCIHYHEGLTFLAYKGARVFEEVHALLAVELDHQLPRKLDVVLTDQADDANGYAISLPYPSVVLYASSPMARQSLQGYDDWLWGLFVHEYTHILHIDTVEGINKVFRALFGGYVKPNRVSPGWMIEGLAVYNESTYTGGGRNRSSWADMLVRMSVLDNRFPSIGEADGYIDDWPGGHLRYIWGGRFHQWLGERYGHGAWTEMVHTHAAQLVPFVLPARKVFGRRFVPLWDEWEDELTTDVRQQQRDLMEAGLTEEEVLTPILDQASRPHVSADGEWVYHNYHFHRGPSAIRRMRPDGSDGRVLTRHWSPQGLSLSADGETLYFAASRPFAIDYTWFDLYRFEVDGKRPFRRQRLTRGARMRDPDVHPDGEQVVCVVNGLGQNDLAIWTHRDGLRRITSHQDYTQIADPRWSPDGRLIAVSVWSPGGRRDIHVVTPQGDLVRRLTDDRAIDVEPVWTPDGHYVLFSSDRGGIYDLFAYRLADGALLRVTRVVGGAFHPEVTPDGQWIVYEGYDSHGPDIRRTLYAPDSWEIHHEPEPAPPVATLPPPPLAEEPRPSRRYNPLPTLLPRYLLPVVDMHGLSVWELGAKTGGKDALRLHAYGVTASYHTGHRYTSWGAWYRLSALRPSLRVGYYTYSLSRGAISVDHQAVTGQAGVGIDGITAGPDVYLEKRHRAYFEVSLPLHARHQVWASYDFEYHLPLSAVPEDAYLPDLPGRGSYSGLQIGYQFRQVRSFRYSTSPEAGFQASVAADLTYPWLGANAEDWNGLPITLANTVVAAETRTYISMPWWRNHVLAIKTAAGTTFGVRGSTGAFRLGGAHSEGSYIGSPSHGYQLRGYRSGAYSGDHLVLLSMEYRFPLFFIERGVGTLPLYMRGVHASVAFDIGQTWDDGDYPTLADIDAGAATVGEAIGQWFGGLRPGMGVELSADLIPLWSGMLRIEVGAMFGLGSGAIGFGSESFYLHLGSSF